MALEITSDSVVKIVVRRGRNFEREGTLLSEGEFGYTVDSKRVFIGDSITPGGNPVGSINFGITTDKTTLLATAQNGDTCRENSANYILSNGAWVTNDPVAYQEASYFFNTSLQYTNNQLRVDPSIVGDGLNLDYSVNGNNTISNTIQKTLGQLNFDARYISLCALSASFYVGNVQNKRVGNNLQATLNADKNVFVNDINASPYQIQVWARDPSGTTNSLIEAMSGSLILKGRNGVGLASLSAAGNNNPQIQVTGAGRNILIPTVVNQGYNNPGNQVYGISRFLSSGYFDSDLYVFGTVYANALSTAKTFVSVNSSLSVFDNGTYLETAFIGNGNALNTQNILRVAGNAGAGLQDYFTIKDSPANQGGIIAFNATPGTLNSTYTVQISGSTGIYATGAQGSGSDRVDVTAGTVNLNGGNLTIAGTSSVVLREGTGSATDYVDVQGALRITQDVTAFYSDKRLKDIEGTVDNSLDKVKALKGVYYRNNENSKKFGLYSAERKVGVVAQDVQAVLPEVVKPAPFDLDKDGQSKSGENYLTVQYEKLVPVLIEAVKELASKVEKLEERVK
jgi:hypothetical protein